MVTAAASPPVSIGFTCTDDELFIFFDKLNSGSPLPSNVIDFVNPYMHKPQYLPGDVLFLIHDSNESVQAEHGIWKKKGEACEVFSNPDFFGWKTTLEYYEGQFPHEHKTNWVMQEFSTTQKRVSDENEKKETRSLCRVFCVSSHETQQNVFSASIDAESRNHLTQLPSLVANSSSSIGSSRNPEVNRHDETEVLAVAERHAIPEHHGENIDVAMISRDHIYNLSGGDFLELNDLDNPASSSSSSENSSISSDECFDAMAFLNDLDQDQASEQTNASKLVNVPASDKSEEIVIAPATLGSLVSVDGSNSSSDGSFKTADYTPISAASGSKVTSQSKCDRRGDGSSSSTNAMVTSGGRKRAGFGGMKNLRKKYLCFWPF